VASRPIVASEAVRGWLVALIVAAGFVFVPMPSWAVDQFYSRGIYPTIQTWLTTATNFIPFAILDVLLIAAVFLTAHRALRVLSVARHVGVLDAGWETFKRVLRVGAVVTIVFMLCWGFNYRRVPLESVLAGGVAPTPNLASVQAAAADAGALAGRLRGPASRTPLSFDDVREKLIEPLNAALEHLGRERLAAPARPKYSLVLTPFFTWTGVDGMVHPLALEAIVNPDLLPFERPYVLAHEWAHLAGMADEAEASAVGWLACMKGPAPLAYSASLYLILETRAALPAELRADVTARLDAGVRSDLDAIADRLRRENPTMQRAATRVYDEYLKVNQVADGTSSYGRALALILTPRVLDAIGNYKGAGRAD
jgi:hypothetical protein